MKKFMLKGVFDGFRSSVSSSQPPKSEMEIEESLRSEHFQLRKTVRHGFPYQPSAMAYDPVQRLLAVGTKTGSLRIFGQPGVDFHVKHDGDVAVIQILFLANEGDLVTACSDDQIHLWNFKQKKPEIAHSLKFQRERLTCIHLPFQSSWLYVGTERGNVHVVNIKTFALSGYIINWNKAIELTRKTHPGPVVHLSDCPIDPNKLLIGFQSGMMVLWDLKSKSAEARYISSMTESLTSVSWHHEGKQFMCSHGDGTITVWNSKVPQKPQSVLAPHAKIGKDGKQEACKPITKVEWRSVRNNEPFVIFSDGMPDDKSCRTPSVTVMNGKSITVLEMEHDVVDFITLVTTPWNNDFQDPYAIAVLLQNDLVVVDLTTPGYPCFENPYPMDIHESPVTACQYFADCPPDLIPAFYSVGSRQKRTGFSENEWPVKGGKWGSTNCSYPEIIITGHADGSVKFWDASSVTLQVLYKLKTSKVFERHKSSSGEEEDDPFAVQHLYLCPESRILCVAGATHVVIFRFCKQEANVDVPTLEVTISYEIYDEIESPEFEYPLIKPSFSLVSQKSGSVGSYSSNASEGKEAQTSVKVRSGGRKWSSGYQPDLCCLVTWVDGEAPPPITSLSVNSSYGLLAFGNECGLAIVDMMQKTSLLNMGTPDLYGSMDPYQRVPRSPKVSKPGDCPQKYSSEESRSPTSDQIFLNPSDQINGDCLSPTSARQKQALRPELKRMRSQGTRKIQKVPSVASVDEPNGGDKNDGSYSRSRSSSVSSLENINKEPVQCLAFADAYSRKTDSYTCPCLWVGTSLGSVLVIVLNLPSSAEQRMTQPVIVSPSGTIFRLKGAILAMSFLDCNGLLIPSISEAWRDTSKDEREREKRLPRQQSLSGSKPRISPTQSTEQLDRQFAIICSEQQARVISLPSQTCAFKVKITDTSFVTTAEVIAMKDSVCLSCYVANGHIMTFSLPSLKPLMDVDFLPLTDLRIVKTFCFSNNGHAMYLCSPSEVQKITLSTDMCDNLVDMLGELYLPSETPEPPKQNFFKNLFNPTSSQLDREELFGEASGKASRGVAKYTAGGMMAQAQARAGVATSEIGQAYWAAKERGEKLGELEERTQQMAKESEVYAKSARKLMEKYKDKKWYQL